jgi:hypothetical protein
LPQLLPPSPAPLPQPALAPPLSPAAPPPPQRAALSTAGHVRRDEEAPKQLFVQTDPPVARLRAPSPAGLGDRFSEAPGIDSADRLRLALAPISRAVERQHPLFC